MKAISEANLSVTTSRNGTRVIGRNAAMDREDNQAGAGYNNRDNYNRGRYRGRGGEWA